MGNCRLKCPPQAFRELRRYSNLPWITSSFSGGEYLVPLASRHSLRDPHCSGSSRLFATETKRCVSLSASRSSGWSPPKSSNCTTKTWIRLRPHCEECSVSRSVKRSYLPTKSCVTFHLTSQR